MLWKNLFSFFGLPNNESESAPHKPEQENNEAEVEMAEQLEVTCYNLDSELLKFLFAADLLIRSGKFEPLNPDAIWNNIYLFINIRIQNSFGILPPKEATEGMWVIVHYEEEKFLGKIIRKRNIGVQVRCLEKPYGIHEPQDMERDENAILYKTLYKLRCNPPKLIQVGRKWQWKY